MVSITHPRLTDFVGEKFEDLPEGGDDEADIDEQYKHHLEHTLKLVTIRDLLTRLLPCYRIISRSSISMRESLRRGNGTSSCKMIRLRSLSRW